MGHGHLRRGVKRPRPWIIHGWVTGIDPAAIDGDMTSYVEMINNATAGITHMLQLPPYLFTGGAGTNYDIEKDDNGGYSMVPRRGS
jgi:hypothetical protein